MASLLAPFNLHDIQTRRSLLPPPASRADPAWQRSWEHLFRTYRPAMERYVLGILRRGGARPNDAEEARDLVQAYLADAIEKGWLARDDREIECFRAWLQTQLRRYVFAWLRARSAKKRSGKHEEDTVLDRVAAEGGDPAEAELDAGWVEVAVGNALERLAASESPYHEVIRDLIATEGEGSEDLGARLGRGPRQLTHLRHRARKRFARLFYEELRKTVRTDEAYEELCARLAPHFV